MLLFRHDEANRSAVAIGKTFRYSQFPRGGTVPCRVGTCRAAGRGGGQGAEERGEGAGSSPGRSWCPRLSRFRGPAGRTPPAVASCRPGGAAPPAGRSGRRGDAGRVGSGGRPGACWLFLRLGPRRRSARLRMPEHQEFRRHSSLDRCSQERAPRNGFPGR